MKTKSYSYEADWQQYAFPEQVSNFSSEEELSIKYTRVELQKGKLTKKGGMPICSDGHMAIINAEDEHTMIFGHTASGKTRKLILPLIATLAQALESMVIMDIKGELSDGKSFPEIRGILDANGYECKFLNFREMNGDGYNLLLEPYLLYKAGKLNEAILKVTDIGEGLASIYHGSKADPFWEMTAKLFIASITILMFELCPDANKVNMLSLASYTDWDSCERMKQIADLIQVENNIMTMLRSVTSEPDRTRMSTLATVNSMLTSFLTNEKLLKMLSTSTFSIHEIYRKPTALFVILPDEVDTYSGIVGIMLQQISATLVQDAYMLGGRLPRRVNFVCDEFNNYYVPGMMRAVSAHRSRNIRWYIVSQSQKQLEACYPKEADTIIANCTNIYFLNSPELSLLEYLSRRAGYVTITEDGSPKPLISVADLQGLKKGWTHTDIYFTSGNLHYVSQMPDISQYEFLSQYKKEIPMPKRDFPTPPIYSASSMLRDARALRAAHDSKIQKEKLTDMEERLAFQYEHLFQKKW